jgi:hypothetical protein
MDLFASVSTNISYWLQEWVSLVGSFEGQFDQLLDIRIPLHLPLQSMIWLLLSATITWIVGNSILLRHQFNGTER